MTAVHLDLQFAPAIDLKIINPPTQDWIEKWIVSALEKANRFGEYELTVRIVDEAEIKTLNETYRRKSGTTNVLSFPFDAPEEVPLATDFLGDIVICAQVIQHEASIQHKKLMDHWAHMLVHGTLHLLGYDHTTAQQAEEMETLEIAILSDFGVPNPYMETEA